MAATRLLGRRDVGARGEAPDEVPGEEALVEERGEPLTGEGRAVGERLRLPERRQDDATDDLVLDPRSPPCTWTWSPMCFPNVWSVAVPSATSRGPRGARPSRTSGSIGVPLAFLNAVAAVAWPSTCTFSKHTSLSAARPAAFDTPKSVPPHGVFVEVSSTSKSHVHP